jgi:hypothetical protein
MLKNFYISEKITNNYFFLFLFFIFFFILSTYLCYWQGMYNNDPVHWGFMLKNAIDLKNGLIPFKDIFIQYGILTTVTHSISLLIYENLFSLIIITNLFFFISKMFIFLIIKDITNDIKISLLGFLTLHFFFSFATIPWSVYISSPFIMGGIYFFLKYYDTKKFYISGLFFGLACLSRQTFFHPIILTTFLFFIFIYTTKKKINLYNLLNFILGLFIPISIFFVYLIWNGLLNYWYIDSVLYINKFVNFLYTNPQIFGFAKIIKETINIFKYAFFKFDTRWLFLIIILILNLILLIKYFKKDINFHEKYLFVFILSILLLWGCYSIAGWEIFRIASSSIVGFSLIFLTINKISFRSYPNILNFKKILLFFNLFFIIIFIFFKNSGNYFSPISDHQIKHSTFVTQPEIFKGKRWYGENIVYYNNLIDDFNKIKNMKKCEIKYEINRTMDNFIPSLSPFKKWQLAPSYNWDFLNKLRSDIDPEIKIKNGNDTVIYEMAYKKDLENNEKLYSSNFYLYKEISVPYALYIAPDQYLRIYLPKNCR